MFTCIPRKQAAKTFSGGIKMEHWTKWVNLVFLIVTSSRCFSAGFSPKTRKKSIYRETQSPELPYSTALCLMLSYNLHWDILSWYYQVINQIEMVIYPILTVSRFINHHRLNPVICNIPNTIFLKSKSNFQLAGLN